MTKFKAFMEKHFEEPFLRAELHRAKVDRKDESKPGFQSNLAKTLLRNHGPFHNWATK